MPEPLSHSDTHLTHELLLQIRLIWPTRLSASKVIFIVGRYGNFILTVIECLCQSALPPTVIRADIMSSDTLGYVFSSASCQSLLTAVTGESRVVARTSFIIDNIRGSRQSSRLHYPSSMKVGANTVVDFARSRWV